MAVGDGLSGHVIAAVCVFLAGLLGASVPVWLDATGRYDTTSKDRYEERRSTRKSLQDFALNCPRLCDHFPQPRALENMCTPSAIRPAPIAAATSHPKPPFFRFLHVGSVFGGGVFIGAGFIHLLPDAADGLDADLRFDGYPVAYAIASLGLLLTLLLEVAAVQSVVRAQRGSGTPRAVAPVDEYAEEGAYANLPQEVSPLMSNNRNSPSYSGVIDDSIFAEKIGDANIKGTAHHGRNPSVSSIGVEVASLVKPHAGDTVGHVAPVAPIPITDMISSETSRFAALAMFVALSFHSALAGIALGVESSGLSAVFIAIMAHKSIAAFALGTGFVRARTANPQAMSRRLIVLWLVAFSLVTPFGILVGTAMTEGDVDDRVAGCFKALAAGTFLYVGLVEIVAKEFGMGATDLLYKSVAVVMGWGIMAVIALWV